MEVLWDVVIVGGGFSGAAVAIELAAQSPELSVCIAEPSGLGRGVAYGTQIEEHILNVPAEAMGLRQSQPERFLQWARERDLPLEKGEFASRRLYGTYVEESLATEVLQAPHRVVWSTTVLGIERGNPAAPFVLRGSDGTSRAARMVVLATGHSPLRWPVPVEGEDDSRLISDPWIKDGYESALRDSVIGILGTGLTAMDVVGALSKKGFAGKMLLISRRGLIPSAFLGNSPSVSPALPPNESEAVVSLRQLVKKLRAYVRESVEQGADWQTAINALRPLTVPFWCQLSKKDRAQFLRHLRPRWEVIRHRMPNEVHDLVLQLQREGRLEILAARPRVIRAKRQAVALIVDQQGEDREYLVDHLFNCTGSSSVRYKDAAPLLRQLVDSGLACIDPLGLGLETDSIGRPLDASGNPSTGLFVLGPLRRASEWESSAARELRDQAWKIASVITSTCSTGEQPHRVASGT